MEENKLPDQQPEWTAEQMREPHIWKQVMERVLSDFGPIAEQAGDDPQYRRFLEDAEIARLSATVYPDREGVQELAERRREALEGYEAAKGKTRKGQP